MTVKPELYQSSSDPATWRLLADAINAEFQSVDMDAARRKPSAELSDKDAEAQRNKAIESARNALQTAINYRWGGTRLHYTVGQLDTDVLILMAEKSVISWQEIFNAKAAFGAAKDMTDIFRHAQLFNSTLNLNSALVVAARPVAITNGLRHEGNAETVEALFKLGADPGHDGVSGYNYNGALFNAVVEGGRPDIGRIFAKYGQNGILSMDNWVAGAKNARKMKLYEDLRKIQWDFGRFTVLDNETLLEQKLLPDLGNLKIIFNFGARRVTEVMEIANPKQTTTKDFTFDEYGQVALEAAHAKLLELGANPSGVESGLRGKAPMAKPAASRTLGIPKAG